MTEKPRQEKITIRPDQLAALKRLAADEYERTKKSVQPGRIAQDILDGKRPPLTPPTYEKKIRLTTEEWEERLKRSYPKEEPLKS